MPLFECHCGLIISTSAETTRCMRCQRSLGATDRLRRPHPAELVDTVVLVASPANSAEHTDMAATALKP
jgi:hypothetical protein